MRACLRPVRLEVGVKAVAVDNVSFGHQNCRRNHHHGACLADQAAEVCAPDGDVIMVAARNPHRFLVDASNADILECFKVAVAGLAADTDLVL